MKTAKEVCEEISNEEINLWIEIIIKHRGKINTHPRNSFFYNKVVYYKGIGVKGYILPNKPNDLILNKLKKLGYKIKEFKAKLPTDYEVKRSLFNKEITPVFEELEWVEISACCGEENET